MIRRPWLGRAFPLVIVACAAAVPFAAAGSASATGNGLLVFDSDRPDGLNAAYDVFTMAAEGSSVTHLTDHGGSEPAWNAAGTMIAFGTQFSYDGGQRPRPSTRWMPTGATRPSSSMATRPTAGQVASSTVIRPGRRTERSLRSCGPAATRSACPSSAGSSSSRSQPGAVTRLTTDRSGFGEDGRPAWSHDGTKIAFDRQTEGGYQIFVMDTEGGNVTQLTSSVFSHSSSPAWSPDDSKIAFESNRNNPAGDYAIWVMNADGGNPVQLTVTDNGAINGSPDWSPDGSKVAFHSNRDNAAGDYEIWVMNADGSSQTRITDNDANDLDPQWQPVEGGPPPVEPPTLTDTDPDSPADDTNPRIRGTAPAGSTVRLYTTADCLGAVAAEGSAADFTSPGLPVTVADGSSTTFYATATDADSNASVCSTTSITYVEQSQPKTGSVFISLDALPDDAQDFGFLSAFGEFALDDDGLADLTLNDSVLFINRPVGSYAVQQPAPGGWDLTGLSCEDPDGGSTVDLVTGTATIDLDDGEFVSCTFTNTKQQLDTTAPTLTLPTNMVVDATSPAGATATYAASASDDMDPSPELACVPGPGSLFPIGMTTVTCTATDEAGNAAQGSFTIHVRALSLVGADIAQR